MKLKFSLIACTAQLAIATIMATPAVAQQIPTTSSTDTSPTAAQPSGGQDIIVTARRREESLQNAPVAVTAFSGEQLAERGINNFQELANITPGFQFASAIGSSLGGVATIRGQSQPESSEASLDASVGFYIDDVYIARQNGILPGMFDIQSVQVLKGPQGTLFGRNTTGGAVVVTTNQPELGKFGGFGQAMYGNYDAWQLQGGLNIPIGEKIAIRGGISINRHDGYAKSTFTGSDLESAKNEAWRLQALFQISEAAKLTLAYNGTHADQTGPNYIIREVDSDPVTGVANNISLAQAAANGGQIGGFTSLLDAFQRSTNPRRTPSDAPNAEKLKIKSFAATLDVEIGSANLKLIGAHRNMKTDTIYDNDGTPFSLLSLDLFSMHDKQDTLELRVSGTALDDRLDWIAGAYYLRETALDRTTFNQLGLALGVLNSEVKNEAYSGFVQLDYKITDKLSATAGIRVGRDNRQSVNRHTTVIPAFALTLCQLTPDINLDAATGGCRAELKAGFTQYAYQLGLNYQASPDLLIYATQKRGFRSGVVNERAVEAATAVPFKPEVIYDFELGAKWSWEASPDLRGKLNSAAYYSIFNDRQLSFTDVTPNGAITTVIEAAEKAHTWGFEVEASAQYQSWLSVYGGVAYTDPKFEKFFRRATATTPAIDLSNQRVGNTPNWQANAGTRVTAPLGDSFGDGFAQVDYTYMSSQVFGFSPRKSAGDPGHGLIDLSAGVSSLMGKDIQLRAFVKNVTNKIYYNNAINLGFAGEAGTAFFGLSLAALGAPRTYGAEVSFKF